MSMTSTQKPNTIYQVRQSSVTPPQKHNINPNYQSCQKMRMSIIDQLSPIKDLPINNSSQRSSFYQVRGKSNGGQHPSAVTTKTQPSRLMDSTSFNTTLNYTQDSQMDRKSNTIPKGMKINNFEILKDQLRFAICQLDDLKKSFDRVVQSQFDQVIQVIKSSSQLSNQLIEDNILLRNQIYNFQQNTEYDKLKGIMEQLQSKITVLVSDNSKLNQQINHLAEENNRLTSQVQESDRRLKDLSIMSSTQPKLQGNFYKENMNPNLSNCSNKSGHTQRELAYKLEQAEIRLLTLQISNDNLRQQLQHNQLDYQGIEQLKETIAALEIKSQGILNQKDSLQQENELLNQKIQNLEKQTKEQSQKSEYIIYIHQLENDLKAIKIEMNNNCQTITSLNNTISQLIEQVNIIKGQKEQIEHTNNQQMQQYQHELQQAGSRYQVLWQEISEMRERLEQRQIQEESGKMLSHAEKALFETQISNLNDKLKDYEQILLHFEQKSRSLEYQLSQYQQECENYKAQIENYNNQFQHVSQQCGNTNQLQLEIQEQQWKTSQLNQIIMRKDKEYQGKSEELQQLKVGYDQLNENIVLHGVGSKSQYKYDKEVIMMLVKISLQINQQMGVCVCTEQITVLTEAPPLTFSSKPITIREDQQNQDEPLIQGENEKNLSQTKTRQMDDSLVLELHRPEQKMAQLTSKMFQTTSFKVKELLDQLGPFEVEEQEGYFYGVYELTSGGLYQGTWMEGLRAGKGVQILKNGATYEGHFSRGMANGRGRMIYADGDYYIGEWCDDQHHGYGEYYHSDNTVYKGNWFENMQHGEGFESFHDQSTYTGQFKLGKRSGFGVFRFPDGSQYEGEFKNNQFNGQGTYIWENGRKYVGSWINDQMDGKGIMTWQDGTKYEGEYKNDKKHGFGILTWPDSRSYSGQWEFGKQNGFGEYSNTTGLPRKGEWVNGKRVKWCD